MSWTSFSEKDWPDGAVWHLELDSTEDFDSVSPEDVVMLHVNKDLIALRRLLQGTARRSAKLAPIAAILTPFVLAGVTTELLRRVLQWVGSASEAGALDLDVVDPESLAGRALEAVRRMGLDRSAAISIAGDDEATLAMIIQSHFDVGGALDQSALDRMLQR